MAASMIQVTYGSTVTYNKEVCSSSKSIREFAEEKNLINAGSSLTLNGSPVKDLTKTFNDLLPAGADSCMLFSVVNAKNA